MANGLYPKFKEALWEQDLAGPLSTADIRAIAVDAADYTWNAAHDFLDDVPGGARVAVSGALAATVSATGILDVPDFSFTAVTGDDFEYVIFYIHDGGSDAARRLLAFFDTGVSGLPMTPNGLDINVNIHPSGLIAL